MLTLTLDTSTHRGTVALSEHATVLEEMTWDKSTSHSEQIVVEIQALYQRAHKKISDTGLIICGIGPGSFTGIRVALSFAKTLAHSYKIPIIPIESCWAIALNAPPQHSESILVSLDAQKNMFFVGEYTWKDSALQTLETVRLISMEDIKKHIKKDTLLISNIPDFFKKNNLTISPLAPHPSASLMFQQVYAHISQHQQISWDQLAPLYLRASAAEEVLLAKKVKDSSSN